MSDMHALQCEMCCGTLEVLLGKAVGVCEYCGSVFTIPKSMEKNGNLFNRATHLRQNCDFDNAIHVYEEILKEDCEDADALWGLVLCRYGIEFVEDPKTAKRIPTCHRTGYLSILSDPDFKLAMQHAEEEKKAVYEEQAKKIDEIQKEILQLAAEEEQYDVFISFKDTDDAGERTVDSLLAQDLYNELTKQKIRTFFSRNSLAPGINYEPRIYSALRSAKVMVVLGTKPEHFNATWVKNEWSRYLDFMKDSKDKYLFPAFRDMSAHDLPSELQPLQALDMSRIGFILDLCDWIKKRIGMEPVIDTTRDNLYSRAMIFLGNREFYKAVDYFEKVLDIDPKYARAYWGSLLASYQCVNANELIECKTEDWTADARLSNAIQFANEEERKLYEDTVEKRVENFKKLATAALEGSQFEKCEFWCDRYLRKSSTDGNIWWLKLLSMHQSRNSKELYDRCLASVTPLIDTPEYTNAVRYSIAEEAEMIEKTVSKIEAAVQERRRVMAYEECKQNLHLRLTSLKRTKNTYAARQWDAAKTDHGAFSFLVAHKGNFFGNNLFKLLMVLFLWAIPVYSVIAWFAMQSGDEDRILPWFGIVYGIFAVFLLMINVGLYIKRGKETSRLIDQCASTERSWEMHKKNFIETKADLEHFEALANQYLAESNLSLEQIEKYQLEFNSYLEKKMTGENHGKNH